MKLKNGLQTRQYDRDRELNMLEVFPKAKSPFATLGIH